MGLVGWWGRAGRLGLVRKYVEAWPGARLSLSRMFQSLGRSPAEAKAASEPLSLFYLKKKKKNLQKTFLADKCPGNKFLSFFIYLRKSIFPSL